MNIFEECDKLDKEYNNLQDTIRRSCMTRDISVEELAKYLNATINGIREIIDMLKQLDNNKVEQEQWAEQ